MKNYNFLQERADAFLKGARYYRKEGDFNLAAFHLEQTCQLYLKHYLFLKLQDFPKTHSLDELLKDIGEAYQKEKLVENLGKKYVAVIRDLEQAYITSRYLPVDFTFEQVEQMEQFVKELKGLLKRI